MSTPSMLKAGLCLLAMAGGLAGAASAQNLDMQGTAGAVAGDGRPASGMTQASVEAAYGAPAAKVAPVGEPPIARWEYAEFVVYFEYDRVIHAVRKR
jgi:hypothetical protein